MAEETTSVVTLSETSKNIRRLRVGRVDAGARQLFDDNRADRGEVEEADDLERDRLTGLVLPHAVAVFTPPFGREEFIAFGRVVIKVGILLDQWLGGVKERLQRRVIGNEEGGGEARSHPGDVDDLLPVEVVAERPA